MDAGNAMAHILSVANQKGGVGKTTTAVNLSTALAAVGCRVLLVDLDPQSNASTGVGIEEKNRHPSTYELLLDQTSLTDVSRETSVPGLWILPASINLYGIELELLSMPRREYRLKEALRCSPERFDYVIVDCPPALGLLTVNALTAAHEIFVPLQCEFYALEGLSQLVQTIQKVKSNFNPSLRLNGIVLTMFDRRSNLSYQVAEDVKQHFGDIVYKTIIPRNIRVSEAPSHGFPVLLYDRNCAGSQAYMRLASEVLQRNPPRKERIHNECKRRTNVP